MCWLSSLRLSRLCLVSHSIVFTAASTSLASLAAFASAAGPCLVQPALTSASPLAIAAFALLLTSSTKLASPLRAHPRLRWARRS